MSSKPKLILFVVMDTARNKGISYNNGTKTPNIHEFIKKQGALRWKYALSPSPWTIPTHVSLFTGLMPSEHRCIDYGFRINKSQAFLPEILRKKGYRTVGIVSNGLLTTSSGFNHGFDKYFTTWNIYQDIASFYRAKNTIKSKGLKGLLSVINHTLQNKPIKSVINMLYRSLFSVKKDSTPSSIRTRKRAIKEIIRSQKKGENLFLFLNFMQPHMDYNPPKNNKNQFVKFNLSETHQDPAKYYSGQYDSNKIDYFSELYQAEVNYLDEEIGKIISTIEDQKMMDESLIILVSDHGEHIGEHGHISHYFSLYNELIHVPMVTKFPDYWVKKLKVNNNENLVQTHDLFQTICEIVDYKDISNQHNSLFSEPRKMANSELFMPSEYEYLLTRCKEYNVSFNSNDFIMNGMQNQESFVSNDLKLILREKGNHELYNFKSDLDEENNLINHDSPLYTDFLKSALGKSKLMKSSIKKRKDSEKMVSRLRALGYY